MPPLFRNRTAAILLSALLGAFTLFAVFSFVQGFHVLDTERLFSNLGFFLLINMNIIVLMVLGFLVIKNVVKLVLDRRRKILGSQLRTRLVIAFVALALVPSILLFFVSRGIVGTVLQSWFSPQVAASVDGALAVAKLHYDQIEADVRRETKNLAAQARDRTVQATGKLLDQPLSEALEHFDFLKTFLEEKRSEYGLTEIAIVDLNGRVLVRSFDRSLVGESSLELPTPDVQQLLRSFEIGDVVVHPETGKEREYLRGYAPLAFAGDIERSKRPPYAVITAFAVSSELRKLMATVIDSYDDYKELRRSRRLVGQTYLLTLLIVTFFVIVAAIWVGFYLAKMITEPIQLLAEGTQEVARGNLQHRIPEIGGDELSILVHSFNTMTEDLAQTTDELVERRRYMETVLASVQAGVISLDRELKVTTCNLTAAQMFGIGKAADALGRPFQESFPRALVNQFGEMMTELAPHAERAATAALSLYVKGQTKQIQVTATKLVDEAGTLLGYVVLLDDLTELVSAQRIAAWQEVARRVAHEIKNPLTPIQLSAQRIQRRFSARAHEADVTQLASDKKLVSECTETIVQQVEALRNLVDEFSRFARMPKSQPSEVNLNELVQETLRIFREAHPAIAFRLELSPALPVAELDREQISRVLVNLLDNAVSAVSEAAEGEKKEVAIATAYDDALGMLSMSISDSGTGIQELDKPKVFEPYFSKKKGGTGLGLAIVSSIVADHQGFVRVRDNSPRGAVFVIELPLRRKQLKEKIV